jgi:hypothetical protein
MESAPSGTRVGCAYFGFIDTDLVRAGFARPSSEAMTGQLPAFMRNPAPLSSAIDAIERVIKRRSARLWAPRWVGAMLLLRGLVQPLTEQLTRRNLDRLSEGMRLADTPGEAEAEDPVLGVAARAIEPSLTRRG